MADITVQVSSAGLTAFGSSSWGSFSYGGVNQPSVTVQAGTLAYPEQGWGGKAWGKNLWGELSDNNVTLTGNSLTISIGTETAEGEINQGWGRSTWGSNIWNGYGTVIPSSNSLSASLNSVTINAEINSGWGGEAWGDNAWGIFGDALVSGNQLSISSEHNQEAWGEGNWNGYNTRWGGVGTVDVGIFNDAPITQAQELNTTVNSVEVTIATEIFLSENPLNTLSISEGTVDPAPDVMPSGVVATASVGTVDAYNEQGWGRDFWGNEVWGDQGEWVFLDVTGVSSSVSTGDEDIEVSVDVELSSQSNPGWGAMVGWGEQSWGQATVDTGMAMSEGTVDPAPDTDITGVQLNTTTNAVSIEANADATVTGQQLTITLGDENSEAVTIASPTGIELTTTMGVPTAGLSVLVEVTGVTSSVSTGIIGLNAWELVDSGTSPTWTVVDKAA